MDITPLPEPITKIDKPNSQTDEPALKDSNKPTARKPLRLWPSVAAAVLLVLAWFVVPVVVPEAFLYALMAGFGAILAIVAWWVFFSRAPWIERLSVVVLLVAGVFVTSRLIHISISNGSMGYLFYVLVAPVLCIALVIWAVVTRRLSNNLRRASLVVGRNCQGLSQFLEHEPAVEVWFFRIHQFEQPLTISVGSLKCESRCAIAYLPFDGREGTLP